MAKVALAFVILFGIRAICFADGKIGATTWSYLVGDSNNQYAYTIRSTNDGGLIAGGDGSWGPFILKLDSDHNIQWMTHPKSAAAAEKIVPVADGYVFGTRYFVYKLSLDGKVLWNRRYADTDSETILTPIAKAQGGFLIGKNTIGGFNVLRLDQDGMIEWAKGYGSAGCSRDVSLRTILTTKDGGYLAAGWTPCPSKSGAPFLLKFDSNGTIQWQKTYRVDRRFSADFRFEKTSDSGYILGGNLQESNDLISMVLVKFDDQGDIIWQKLYDKPLKIKILRQTLSGGFLLADFAGEILKVNSLGEPRWHNDYQLGRDSGIYDLNISKGSGILAAGHSIPPIKGKKRDVWLLKINSNGQVDDSACVDVQGLPLPVAQEFTMAIRSERITIRSKKVQNSTPLEFRPDYTSVQTTITGCD